MPEPATGWLTMGDEDELPDDIEFDPRWEVQPAPEVDDGSESGRHRVFLTALLIVLIVAAFAWLLGTLPTV